MLRPPSRSLFSRSFPESRLAGCRAGRGTRECRFPTSSGCQIAHRLKIPCSSCRGKSLPWHSGRGHVLRRSHPGFHRRCWRDLRGPSKNPHLRVPRGWPGLNPSLPPPMDITSPSNLFRTSAILLSFPVMIEDAHPAGKITSRRGIKMYRVFILWAPPCAE